jgi:hypothetical protein
MNVTLWIIAGALAAVFLAGSASKLFVPKDRIAAAPGGKWVEDFSSGAVKALGVLDVLAAVGLVLPAALGIAPVVVPVAAVGVVLLMVGAVITRTRHGGTKAIPVDLTYLTMAVVVAVGRFGPESFS